MTASSAPIVPRRRSNAKSIYEKVVTKGTIRLTDDLTAEMCKLTENTFRDINIAYANELSKVCDRLGIDVFQLIELANCHPRVNVHTPASASAGTASRSTRGFILRNLRTSRR